MLLCMYVCMDLYESKYVWMSVLFRSVLLNYRTWLCTWDCVYVCVITAASPFTDEFFCTWNRYKCIRKIDKKKRKKRNEINKKHTKYHTIKWRMCMRSKIALWMKSAVLHTVSLHMYVRTHVCLHAHTHTCCKHVLQTQQLCQSAITCCIIHY